MDGTVLIADDDRSIRTVLTQALTRAGCRVHATGSLTQLQRWVEEGRGDLVVTDVVMPDGNGLDAIPAIRGARPDLPVIVISAQNTIVTAIRATEAEAFDYLPKPFDLPELLARIRAGLSRQGQRSGPDDASNVVPGADPASALVGHAPAMQALFRSLARVVNADLPVMVTGEPGAGRSTVARAVHEFSDRRDGPLVVLTAAESVDAMASAIARAAGGTLLIEDPAAMDRATQARLTGLLSTIETDVNGARSPRLVTTCGPDPMADVAADRLRQDLHYRLAGITLSVPPLRTRLDDIPALARHLLARAAMVGLPARELSDAGAAALRAWPFPGNVRELDNLVRRLALTSAGPQITEAEIREVLDEQPPPSLNSALRAGPSIMKAPLSQSIETHLQRYFDLHGDALPPAGLYDRILREMERPLIEIALDATAGNQLRCAELLGINRNTLRKKITDLNIEVARRRRLM